MVHNPDSELAGSNKKKLQSILLLLVTLAAVVIAVFLYSDLRKQKNEVENSKSQLLTLNDSLESLGDSLEALNDTLKKLIQAYEQKDSTLEKVLGQIKDQEDKKLVENANTFLALYTYGFPNDFGSKIIGHFREEGYTSLGHRMMEDKPGWFAPKNTIFYYNPRMEAKARQVGAELEELFNVKIHSIHIGAGNINLKDKKDKMIVIHLSK